MRVVFVNRIAWPDEGATAIYVTDVAEAVAAAGHEVHVVCGAAGYRPARPGDARAPGADAPEEAHGVRYHRLPGERGQGLLRRALGAVAFLWRVARRLASMPRPDVVVALTDPPYVDVVAGFVARRRGARTIHWLMDVYPDVAEAAGVIKPGSLPAKVLGGAMAWGLQKADEVVVLSEAMRRPILARGVARRRLHVIENWAPAEVEAAADRPRAPRREGPPTLLYSGNFGVAHDLTPLLDAFRALDPSVPLRLVVQAGGGRADRLRQEVQSGKSPTDRVEWRDPVPREGLAESLLAADAHLVSVRKGFERLLFPSKTYGPLALGLPLVVLGARTCGPSRILRRLHAGATWSSADEITAGLRAVSSSSSTVPTASLRRRDTGRAAWLARIERARRER